jgi:phosphatidylserine decarboxylase
VKARTGGFGDRRSGQTPFTNGIAACLLRRVLSAQREPIRFFNRYTGQIEVEQIYGEPFMRWTYGTRMGKLALHALAKRALFARWYGWRMNRAASSRRVAPFIQRYGVDAAEFVDTPESFKSFNEFFYRKLKSHARPIDPDPNSVVFPADGRHLGFQDISKMEGIFVKGQTLDLQSLLNNGALARQFASGSMVMSRLCPTDYHRFHFPVAGIPEKPVIINGPLYSVSPIALRENIRYLSQNKRALCAIRTENVGTVLMLEIGATNVGSIVYTFVPGQPVQKGAEKGYFKFGGSSMITLFEPNTVQLAADLLEQSRQNRELYARVGDRMGVAAKGVNIAP